MTAAQLLALAQHLHDQTLLYRGLTDQVRLLGALAKEDR